MKLFLSRWKKRCTDNCFTL